MSEAPRINALLKLILTITLAGNLLSGCAVIAVADAVVSVGAAAVSTTASVGSAVVGTTVDVARAGVHAATKDSAEAAK